VESDVPSGARLRAWLPLAALVLAAAVLLPPGSALARQYVFAQAAQFAVLAVVVPPLVVLGAPWRLWPAESRLGRVGSRGRATVPSFAMLAGFIVVALGWRVPGAVNALVRYPGLTVVEAVTLVGAGCGLWLELVDSPPLRPRISLPLRAAFSALPMWAIWASAYVMGFSRAAWFTSLAHRGVLGTVADQQIAAGLLVAIAGLSFVPVVYFSLITWLRDSGGDDLATAAGPAMPRPPRGWRRP
jgi:cytochrome c oxidase assembly factor CtaG